MYRGATWAECVIWWSTKSLCKNLLWKHLQQGVICAHQNSSSKAFFSVFKRWKICTTLSLRQQKGEGPSKQCKLNLTWNANLSFYFSHMKSNSSFFWSLQLLRSEEETEGEVRNELPLQILKCLHNQPWQLTKRLWMKNSSLISVSFLFSMLSNFNQRIELVFPVIRWI